MVYVFLADGFEEIEALSVVDILRRGEIGVKTVSITDNKTVMGAHSIPVIADIYFSEISDDIELIVLPGGMPGTTNLLKCDNLCTLISDENKKGTLISAICAAPMILGNLGILKGKTATCYPSFEKYLDGATIGDKSVCIDGNIITSRGPGTASEFAFAITEVLKGKETKDKLCGDMLYA